MQGRLEDDRMSLIRYHIWLTNTYLVVILRKIQLIYGQHWHQLSPAIVVLSRRVVFYEIRNAAKIERTV